MASNVRLSDQILSTLKPGEKRARENEHCSIGSDEKRRKFDRGYTSSDSIKSISRPPKRQQKSLSAHPIALPKTAAKAISGNLPSLPPIKDAELAKKVFLHQSRVSEKDIAQYSSSASYESLEWYGDAILQIIATRLIHQRYPTMPVGHKAQVRQELVENEALAVLSKEYGFAKPGKIVLNESLRDEKSKWTKILGDVFEAYVGALVECDPENGMTVVEEWLAKLWEPAFAAIDEDKTRVNNHGHKQQLQQLLANSSAGVKLLYEDVEPMKVDKARGLTWHSRRVLLTGWGFQNQELGRGYGWATKHADNDAAKNALHENKDIIDSANSKKKEYEKQRKEEKEELARRHGV